MSWLFDSSAPVNLFLLTFAFGLPSQDRLPGVLSLAVGMQVGTLLLDLLADALTGLGHLLGAARLQVVRNEGRAEPVAVGHF